MIFNSQLGSNPQNKNLLYVGVIVVVVILLTVMFRGSSDPNSASSDTKKPDCPPAPSPWGSSFEGVHHSRLVNMTCQLEGFPICCRLVDSDPYPRKIYEGVKLRANNECEVKKEYVPSAYELAHIACKRN
jgi:hypothetical protein